MADPVSRRRFLGAAATTGIGAAVASTGIGAGVLGASLGSVASAATPHAPAPATPPGYWQLVSRPDLRPPQVSVATAPGYTPPAGEPQYLFLAPTTAPNGTYPKNAQAGLMICNRLGQLVWFHPLSGSTNLPFNFRTQSYQGKSVLTWWQGTLGPGFGTAGGYHMLNTNYQQIAAFNAAGVPSDLHECLITPHGTALVSAYDASNINHVICHVQEVDITTGHLIWEWTSSGIPQSDSYISGTGDTFHLNSIDLWPDPKLPSDQWDFLISARQTSAVYRISRATKQIMWQAGGKRPRIITSSGAVPLSMVGPAARFYFQHDARPLHDGSGFSIFDDASQNPVQNPSVTPEHQSWGKVFNLNLASREVTIRHQYNNTNTHIQTGSQGNCQLLPNGGHLVGYGAVNAFSEFGPSGTAIEAPLVLDGRLPTGVETYRIFLNDWAGAPALSELAFVVHKGSSAGSFDGYVSWNGHTAVATWKVLAGTSSSTLRPVATSAKTHFETTIPFTASGATEFAVEAYTSNGRLLATSKVTTAQ